MCARDPGVACLGMLRGSAGGLQAAVSQYVQAAGGSAGRTRRQAQQWQDGRQQEALEAHLQKAGDQLAEGVGVGLHQPLLHLRVLDVRPEAQELRNDEFRRSSRRAAVWPLE